MKLTAESEDAEELSEETGEQTEGGNGNGFFFYNFFNCFFYYFFNYNFFDDSFFNYFFYYRNKRTNSCNEFFVDNYTESFSECVDFVNFFNYFFGNFFNYFFSSFFYYFFGSFFYYFFCGYEKSEESFNKFGGNFNAAESCDCVNGFSVKNYFFNDLTFFFGDKHNACIIRCDFFDYSFFCEGSYSHSCTQKSGKNKGKRLLHFEKNPP